MEEKKEELTPREQAIKVIQEGGSVQVGGILYTLRGREDSNKIKSIRELPGDEAFIGNDENLKARTLQKMAEDMKALQARYDALKSKEAEAPAKKAVHKSEPKAETEESK